MTLWRISNHPELSGLGGERLRGRWHTAAPGKRVVYLSEHPAVALIENLANLSGDPNYLPTHFQLLKVASEDVVVPVAELSTSQLATINERDIAGTQAIGDAWLAAKSSALLRIPSIPSPESWNYLLNPRHPEARTLKIEWARTMSCDKRLFHLSHS
jgi:RES domain-containing protein